MPSTDLVPTPAKPPATTTMPQLSGVLTSLLDAPGTVEEGARWIAQFAETLAEARAALPALRAVATTPATPEAIKRVIMTRFVTYPQPQRNDGEWRAWWQDYHAALAGLSLPALEAGMQRWVATDQTGFLPKPGQLAAMARATPSVSGVRYLRAAAAVRLADTPISNVRAADPAMRQQVGKLLADLARGLGGGGPVGPVRRGTVT